MSENYIIRTELTAEEKKLAAAAEAASREAVQAAFAAGLSITIEPVAKPCKARGRISVKCAKREDIFRFRKVHFTEMHPRGGFATASSV